MKLMVNGLDLAEAVSTVARVTSAKAINPMLEGIKMIAEGDTLTLVATDLEMYIQKVIRADVKAKGTVIVPGKLFAEYARKLESAQVSVTADGNSIVVGHGENAFNFTGMPVEEFPEVISLTKSPHFTIKSEELKDFVSKCKIAVAEDDARPILKGICCEIVGNKLTGVALDGFRLSKVEKAIDNSVGDTKVIIPAKSLEEVRKLLADDSGEVNVVIEDKFFQVQVGGATFASRMIEGEFINYKQIIPAAFTSDVVVEKAAFVQAIDRAGLLVRSDKINLVTLKVADKQVHITSNNEIGKINEKVSASLTGKDVVISFNAKYLFDALRATNSEFIKLCFNGDLAPMVMVDAKQGDYLFLVLPVRLQG